jgi:hypothetical protein
MKAAPVTRHGRLDVARIETRGDPEAPCAARSEGPNDQRSNHTGRSVGGAPSPPLRSQSPLTRIDRRGGERDRDSEEGATASRNQSNVAEYDLFDDGDEPVDVGTG